MARPTLTLKPLQNEYLSLVFYLRSPLRSNELVRTMHELIGRTLDIVNPPPGELALYPQDPFEPEDPRWQPRPGRGLGGHTLFAKGVSDRKREGLNLLVDAPADTERITIDCERRDRDSKVWMPVWSVKAKPPDPPTAIEHTTLDSRLHAHFHTTLFTPSDEVWRENEDGDEEFVSRTFDCRARALVDGFLDVIGSLDEVYTGNVEVVREFETAAGMYYSSVSLTQRTIPWHRQLEHALWANAGPDRHNFVRRVSWGTLLGPDIARRLDRDGTWLEQFSRYNPNPHGEQCGTHWSRRLDSGALFLAASDNPLEVSQWEEHGFGFVERPWENAAWLHRELNKAGLLL